jgi:hypothetical protein
MTGAAALEWNREVSGLSSGGLWGDKYRGAILHCWARREYCPGESISVSGIQCGCDRIWVIKHFEQLNKYVYVKISHNSQNPKNLAEEFVAIVFFAAATNVDPGKFIRGSPGGSQHNPGRARGAYSSLEYLAPGGPTKATRMTGAAPASGSSDS